ncbi:MAG: hypothetical protein ACR2GD_02975 [Pyrinomonadaceae bacterium]
MNRKYIFILIILHLAIVLPLAYLLNIWMDEASTLHTTERGIFYALQHAAADEKQAPLYFYILSLWRALNHSIFFARLFSIFCGAFSIKLFYDAARGFFDENATKFIAAIFALHPALIWASLEIRVYALVILLTILLLKLFFETYLETESLTDRRRKKEILYIALAVFALYTNYYLGFVLVGNFCALLAVKKFQKAKTYFWQMLVVGACLLPLGWIIKEQFAANTGGFQSDISAFEGFKIIWWHLLNFVLPIGFPPLEEKSAIFIARIWAARAGILILLLLSAKNKFCVLADEKIKIFAAMTAAICLLLLGFYFFVGTDYVAPRHALPLFAPLVLLAFSIFIKLLPRRSWIICALVFAFLFSYSLCKQYAPLAKRGDWIRVAKFIETHEKPNQPIIVFQNFDALSLPYYYHGANKILPDKNFFAWSYEDSVKSENALEKQTEFVISQIPPDAPEIWLATEELCQNEKSATACAPLENFVEANYTTVITQDFYKERVRLLRKR